MLFICSACNSLSHYLAQSLKVSLLPYLIPRNGWRWYKGGRQGDGEKRTGMESGETNRNGIYKNEQELRRDNRTRTEMERDG